MLKTILAAFKYILILTILFSASTQAQNSEEKIKISLRLSYFSNDDGTKTIEAKATARQGRTKLSLENYAIEFFISKAKEISTIGKAKINAVGEAHMLLPENISPFQDADGQIYFIAKFMGNEGLPEKQTSLNIKPANLIIELAKDESENTATAYLFELSNGKETPLADVDIRFYIERSFEGHLPIKSQQSKTDENGKMSVEVPKDIPGDASGTINIIAKVEGHELYGNLQTIKPAAWGIKPVYEDLLADRSLFGERERAPYILLILVNSIILIVWGFVFYIAFQLIRVRKNGIKKG